MTARRARRLLWAVGLTASAIASAAWGADSRSPSSDAPPKSLDPRLTIELFAEAPQIVTPTDLAVDYLGRIWAIESNTHFPPAGYKGHPSDRILVFRPGTRGEKSAPPQMFADGFRHAMSIAVPYGDGVYVATRREVFHLVDKDGDGKADERRSILKLETKGDYPHNGLAGFAFDGLGYMYIGLGENLGADYRLIGTDGRSLSGGGEGGSLFRFKPDGSDLTLWATGFWNPHASCVDAFGRMFTVDNDPDDRPPCRLLHIIPGGDYGYRFRNGRRGIHPFTAWDGELPGTLPMVCGTGEAPSGIIAYESDTFPEEYRGSLLASSWGDHRVDRFRPKPKGTSFTAKLEPIIVGGENFRPVGVALAPDGTVYITDWVLKDYNVHGKGRIWRILPAQLKPKPVEDLDEIDRLPYHVSVEIAKKLNSPRMDIRRQAARHINPAQLPPDLHFQGDKKRADGPDYDKLISSRGWHELYWAWCRGNRMNRQTPLRSGLSDAAWPDFEWKQGLFESVGTAQAFEALANSPAAEDKESLFALLKHPVGENPSCVLVRLARSTMRFPTPWDADPTWLSRALAGGDPFVFTTVVECLKGIPAPDLANLIRPERTPSIQVRLALLLAARHGRGSGYAQTVLPNALKDPDPRVRFTAIQWVGEARLAQFRGEIERELSNPKTTADLFEASLASLEMLDGVKRKAKNEFSGADYALRLACDQKAADGVRAMALRIVPLDHKGLTFSQMKELIQASGPQLRFEAVRTFRDLPFPGAAKMERELALDEHADKRLRLEAIAGLALALERNEHDVATIAALRRLLVGKDSELATQAMRALRRSARVPEVRSELDALASRLEIGEQTQHDSHDLADQLALCFRSTGVPVPAQLEARATPRPRSVDDWIRLAGSDGDPEAGRRLFDFPNSVACSRCHTVHGRGGKIGPDLSTIARSSDRTKLAESILRPAKEIAPQFATWSFVTRGGRTISGVLVSEDREGHVRIGGADGRVTEIDASEIEERVPQKTSIMPERLTDLLTAAEFRDLVAFLATLR
jgi:putative membrane-bound dehydrogenase-like protein